MTQAANSARVMRNGIDAVFKRMQGRPALILYLTAGHPDLPTSLAVAPLVAGLCDIVEIGIPFSDPVADGPIIQASSQTALDAGTTVADCFSVVRAVRAAVSTPIVFLTYYNPIVRFGLSRFAAECREADVAGVIAADVPPEEAGPLSNALGAQNVHLIPLIAPTSPDERIARACALGGGFVYCISRAGVTGVREDLNADLAQFLSRAREVTDMPRAVGFGVSTAEQARTVGEMADGVIIGSALVRILDSAPPAELEQRVLNFVSEIRAGIGRE